MSPGVLVRLVSACCRGGKGTVGGEKTFKRLAGQKAGIQLKGFAIE